MTTARIFRNLRSHDTAEGHDQHHTGAGEDRTKAVDFIQGVHCSEQVPCKVCAHSRVVIIEGNR